MKDPLEKLNYIEQMEVPAVVWTRIEARVQRSVQKSSFQMTLRWTLVMVLATVINFTLFAFHNRSSIPSMDQEAQVNIIQYTLYEY
jgi:hypothetical protein